METFNWDTSGLQLWDPDLEPTKIQDPASKLSHTSPTAIDPTDHEVVEESSDKPSKVMQMSIKKLHEDIQSSPHYQEFCDIFPNKNSQQSESGRRYDRSMQSYVKQNQEFFTKHGMQDLTQSNKSATPYTEQLWDIKESYTEAMNSIKLLADERYNALQENEQLQVSKFKAMPSSALDLAFQTEFTKIENESIHRRTYIEQVSSHAIQKLRLECRPTRKRRNLPPVATKILTDWYNQHNQHPYPSDPEKLILAKQANIKVVQVNNWFSNRRNRKWGNKDEF